jgi:homoserine kinase
MMSATKVCVKVPASTANLGPGFDVFGLALDLYAWIEMGPAEVTQIELLGSQLTGIPTDKSNLIYKVAQMVFERAGVHLPELQIAMYSDIPLTRGLGSSASAIVGALVAANAMIGEPLAREELFQLASTLEGHPDNVGASLFGGLVIAYWDGNRAIHTCLRLPQEIEVLVAIPHFMLETEKARDVLPQQLSRREAVYNIAHASLLVAALANGELPLIRHAMRDCLHQPYRASLIPGMEKVLAEATEHGALGVALSGAGPTLLALVDRRLERKRELEHFLMSALNEEGVTAELLWLNPALEGAQRLTSYAEHSTLLDNIQQDVRRSGRA